MKTSKIFSICSSLLMVVCVAGAAFLPAKAEAAVSLEYDQRIGMDGLYFWYADPNKPAVNFNREVTPKGNALTISNGYAFLVWYKGGMSVRNLMLSRMKIGSNTWKTIQFPETNTLYTGTDSKGKYWKDVGDSHRTAAIAVSAKDGTIHIFHDAHSSKLRYRLSKKDIAYVSDADFKLENFYAERDYLRTNEHIASFTYPDVEVNNAGEIVLGFRVGTSRQGDFTTTHYDGSTWAPMSTVVKGDNAQPTQFNMYGGLLYQQGRMYYAGTMRVYGSDIGLNQGLYMADAGQRGTGNWTTAGGATYSTPITSIDAMNKFKVAEPLRSGSDGMSGAPSFLVSNNGSMHFSANEGGQRHFYKAAGKTSFVEGNSGAPATLSFASGTRIYGVSIFNGRLELRSSPESSSDWRTDYTYNASSLATGVYRAYQGKLYVVAAETVTNSDKRPFRMLVINLGEGGAASSSSSKATSSAASSKLASSSVSSKAISSSAASSKAASSAASSKLAFSSKSSAGGDQCNTTAQCQSTYGSKATDCLNSGSTSSICMCGGSRCDSINWTSSSSSKAASSKAASSVASSKAASSAAASKAASSSKPITGDQCNTTAQCKSIYGSAATDCLNSGSTSSICMCGGNRCDSINWAVSSSSKSSSVASSKAAIGVVVGGVSGITALKTANNSDQVRAAGGGLYMHHSGWAPLSAGDKDAILKVFAGQPSMVEIGYGSAPWVSAYLSNYHKLGVRPKFITANAFDKNNLPTIEGWKTWMKGFRDAGVGTETKILPTFEYANFADNVASLSSNTVSKRADFQAIISASGGITLDTPSGYFFGREAAYRDWVIDAIKWTKSHGYSVVIIVSPHSSKENYDEDSKKYFDYLVSNSALPDLFAVENYSTADPATYVNIVGSEDVSHQQLGVAKLLLGWINNLK